MPAVSLEDQGGHGGAHVAEARSGEARMLAELHARAAQVVPAPGEHAVSFAARLRARLATARAPDFAARLAQKAAAFAETGRSLRLLVLGSAAGVAEGALLRACPSPVELILAARDEAQLAASVAAIPPRHRVDCRLVDLEAGLAQWNERFDVVFSHATLARLTRLEPLLVDLRQLLAPGGELWLAREYVGLAGGRMDERDAARAEAMFRGWPARIRGTDGDGSEVLVLPAVDDASTGASARHGERLLPWLHGQFAPVEEGVTNALLWRVLPPALAARFDLARAEDVAALRSAAVEDVLHVRSGGRPVMLDGVYRLS